MVAALASVTETTAFTLPRLRGTRSTLDVDREASDWLRLAGPMMLVAFVNMSLSVTGTFMAAPFGIVGLAAIAAVGSDFCSIVFTFAAGVLAASRPF